MKQVYIYRLEAGYDYADKPEVIEFFYAPNRKTLVQYAQEMFHDKKYNSYKTVKVGLTKEPEETRMISDFESFKLKQHYTANAYSERIDP